MCDFFTRLQIRGKFKENLLTIIECRPQVKRTFERIRFWKVCGQAIGQNELRLLVSRVQVNDIPRKGRLLVNESL